jgi:hypothetical protein
MVIGRQTEIGFNQRTLTDSENTVIVRSDADCAI